ncbi:DsbA family protein [Pseudonocardia nigra]|uniref:DsbA family protein n=1 Tax=Pseudonocardia nigra TaxID=1921578 RepID=UPI001C5F373A|nr:thioredoxin domain-containing protein [Pseudonocardia nigra]
MAANRTAHRRRPAAVGRRRGPSGWAVAAVVTLVLFAGAVGVGVYRAQQADALVVPAGATATGVAVGSPDAPVTVDVYLDFQCPACRAYEAQSGATLDELVAAGAARVVYHPVAYLDRFSSTRYASRSSAAAGCAAEAGVYPRFQALLFAHQPPENTAGLPDERLVALGEQAGAGPDFGTCVAEERYAAWTAHETDEASRAGITATPTVLVDGREIARTDEALRAAVPIP